MGQFKPMVKMMTTEPSVELKLKNGGAVAMKKGGSTTKAKKMADGGMGGLGAAGAMAGQAPMVGRPAMANPIRTPAKPTMASRRKAMMAKPAMKEGGETKSMHKAEMSKMSGLEKELKSHESKPASKAHKGLKTGGVVDGQGGYKDGGIIKSTSGKTIMHTAKPDHSPAKTGGVKMGNGGGYKTGGVAKANAGGYKKGGYAKKFADGGSVQADGRAVKMPQGQKKPSQPVSISRLSGTFKTGGSVTPAEGRLQKIHKSENATAMKQAKMKLTDKYSKYQGKKMADGGDPMHGSARESEGYKKFYENEKAENEADRKAAMDALMHPVETMKSLPGKIREGFNALKKGMSGQGAVTTTEREVSRTVSPGKKRGGRAC
jgi:hypothetical protein